MSAFRAALPPLSTLYGLGGAYTTAYLDVDPGDVAGTVSRWEQLQDRYADDGIDDEDIEAVDEMVLTPSALHARGRVVVVCHGQVVLSETTPSSAANRLRSAPLPDLFPYVAARLRVVPNLVIAPLGEQLRVLRVTPTGHEPLWSEGGSEDTFDRAFARLASNETPELVIVAGDYGDCRRAVARTSQTRVLTADVAMRMVDADPHDVTSIAGAAEDALRWHLAPVVDAARQAVRVKGAATGAAAVTEALRMAQARTVVVGALADLPERCWIGPRPTEFGLRGSDARRAGIAEPRHDRFDAALVRAVAATTTELFVLPPGAEPPPGGIAATLRT